MSVLNEQSNWAGWLTFDGILIFARILKNVAGPSVAIFDRREFVPPTCRAAFEGVTILFCTHLKYPPLRKPRKDGAASLDMILTRSKSHRGGPVCQVEYKLHNWCVGAHPPRRGRLGLRESMRLRGNRREAALQVLGQQSMEQMLSRFAAN
jgi:hypothetical protein